MFDVQKFASCFSLRLLHVSAASASLFASFISYFFTLIHALSIEQDAHPFYILTIITSIEFVLNI